MKETERNERGLEEWRAGERRASIAVMSEGEGLQGINTKDWHSWDPRPCPLIILHAFSFVRFQSDLDPTPFATSILDYFGDEETPGLVMNLIRYFHVSFGLWSMLRRVPGEIVDVR